MDGQTDGRTEGRTVVRGKNGETGNRSCRTELEKWHVGDAAQRKATQTKGATFEKMNMKQKIFLQ